MKKTVLGIDPGSRTTGFAVLSRERNSFKVIACDVLRMDSMESHNDRLQFIFDSVTKILQKYSPDECAVETPIYGVDPLAMLKLGRAQAASILAITNQDIPVSEYYPKVVKKAITGNGNASKQQVAFMLHKMLKMPDSKLPADATDALSVAWCHFINGERAGGKQSGSKMHQNNRKSGWEQFVADNPDRVKKH
jgi:crossover junction endodeoxyribonuclease RuvC